MQTIFCGKICNGLLLAMTMVYLIPGILSLKVLIESLQSLVIELKVVAVVRDGI